MPKTLSEIMEQMREALSHERVSALHFAPRGLMRGGVKNDDPTLDTSWEIDFGDDAKRAEIAASLQEWVTQAPTSVIVGHWPMPGTPPYGAVRAIVDYDGDDARPPGLYAVCEWTPMGFAALNAGEVPACSMWVDVDREDHAGRVWRYSMRHLAIVEEPQFSAGQARPLELIASNQRHRGSAVGAAPVATCLVAAFGAGAPGGEMEEMLKDLQDMLKTEFDEFREWRKTVEERFAARDAEQNTPDEAAAAAAAEDREGDAPAAAAAEDREGDAPAAAAAVASSDAGAIRRLEAEVERLRDAEMTRRATDAVDAALSEGKFDPAKRSALIASAKKGIGAFIALADAVPARPQTQAAGVTPAVASATPSATPEDVAEERVASWVASERRTRSVSLSEYNAKLRDELAKIRGGA